MSTSDSLLALPPRMRILAWTTQIFPLRLSERVLLGYFFYTSVLAMLLARQSIAWKPLAALAWGAASLVIAVAWADKRCRGRLFSVVRDWLPAPFILVAYWSIDWLPAPVYRAQWERNWIAWDRFLLNDWGGRALIERFGSFLPGALEFSYSLLYAVPPFSIAILYLCRRRVRVDRFLFLFLSGTLLAYALLPHFPVRGPRTAFAAEDLPTVSTPFRSFNVWLLDRLDIRTSVFPSGHVAAGFSAAFAMLLVLPERRWIGWTLMLIAISVMVATVYGRYHYAVDGLASLAVSAGAILLSGLCCPSAVSQSSRAQR